MAIQTYSNYHIDAIIGFALDSQQWRFIGFYGHPDTNKREKSWLRLDKLANSSSLLLVCMGDFNGLMHGKQKEGCSKRLARQMEAFCKVINKCHL